MSDPTKELAFQSDVIAQMGAAGWKLGDPARYDRALARATTFPRTSTTTPPATFGTRSC